MDRHSMTTPTSLSTPTPTKKTETPKDTSMTNDNISRFSQINKKYEGLHDRKTICFRGSKQLYNDFKPVSKSLFGSTCKAFETFMASILVCAESPANICNTTNAQIDIGKIVIERNLDRERRNLTVERRLEGVCEVCGKVAYARCINEVGYAYLCHEHFLKGKKHYRSWKLLEESASP